MSNPNGPVRRRRIAGEGTPATAPVEPRRLIVPKPKKDADKAPSKDKIGPKGKAGPKKAPAKSAPVAKAPVTKFRPVKAPLASATVVEKAPAVEVKGRTTARATVVSAPAAVESPSRRGFPRVPSKLIPLVVVALLAVVFGAVFGAKGVADYRAERGIDTAHATAAAAASKAAETVFTYQYNKLPEHLKASEALMTPKFQKEFASVAPALSDLAPQRQIVVLSQARGAAVVECGSSCSADRASVLVFLDQARLIGTSTTPTVFGNRIVVDMVRSHGTWLVDNIIAL